MTRISAVSARFAGPLAGGLVATGILLPFLCYGFSWDQMVFSTMGDALLRGGVLYRDAWEHKPPGIYWTYYLIFLLLGREYWIVRAVEIAALAASSGGLFHVARRWTESALAGLVAAVALPTIYFLFIRNSAQPETFQIPCLVFALVLWPDQGETRRLTSRCFATGVLLSGVVLFKTPGVLLVPLFPIARLIRDRGEASVRRKLRLSLVTLAGLLLVPVLMTAYYALRGAWSELFDALVTFPFKYSGLRDHGFDLHYRMAMDWTTWLVPWSMLAVIGVGILRGLLFRPKRLFWWALLAAAAVGSVSIQAKYFPYHHILLAPMLALGASFAFLRPPCDAPPANVWVRRADPVLRGLAMTLGLVALAHHARAIDPLWTFRSGLARTGTIELVEPRSADPPGSLSLIDHGEVLQEIAALTGPEDSIFVWGDDPSLYFLSHRKMAGPYCHLLLVVPPWGGEDRLRSLIRRLDREKPPLLILTPGIHFWTGLSMTALLEKYPEMKEYIRDQYALRNQGVGYQIWKRTN